jgi:hypothetical protein
MKKQTLAYGGLILAIILVGILIVWIAKKVSVFKLGRKAKLEIQSLHKPLPKWKTTEKPWTVPSSSSSSSTNDNNGKFIGGFPEVFAPGIPSEKTILILIVSRPGQINRTTSFISHAIETSAQPNRLRFGVVCAEPTKGNTHLQKFDSFWKLVLKYLKKTTLYYRNNTIQESLRNNVRVSFLERGWISAYHAVGVAEKSFYQNEHFVLYTENWIGLAPGWDNDCISLLSSMASVIDTPVLSHPPVTKEITAIRIPASFYAFQRWSSRDIPLFSQKPCVSLAQKCYRGLKRTPEFAFSSSDILSFANHRSRDWNTVPDRDWSWGMTARIVQKKWIPYVPPYALVYYRSNPWLEPVAKDADYSDLLSSRTQYSKLTNEILGIDWNNKKTHAHAGKGITPQPYLPTDQIATWYGDMDTFRKSHA